MERGPLPPHERTWRHPSELAAAERDVARAEAAAPSTRVFALTTGTVGLIAVGILILTVTPRTQSSPVAVSASTTVATTGPATDVARLTESVRPRAVAGATTVSRPVEPTSDPLATPIGNGRLALVTAAAVNRATGSTVAVRFSGGDVGEAVLVRSDDDIVVVEVERAGPGLSIAAGTPDDDDVVKVMATPPITVAYSDVPSLNVDEGTAVVDHEGRLVGLCSRRGGDGRVEVVGVSGDLAGATNGGR